VLQLRGGQGSVSRPLAEARAVEYFHRGFLHLFITADPREIAMMDMTPSPWVRTGDTIRVWSEADATLSPACRFWSDQAFAPRSSHFYTPYVGECATLKSGSTVWKFEGNAFYLRMPDDSVNGLTCPPGTQALYRAYNNGLSGAPNHRYMTSPAVLDAMIGLGSTFEGDARTRIFACVPLQ
jgi:hypothetical protein